MRCKRLNIVAFFLATALTLASQSAFAASPVKMTDLGVLPGGRSSVAISINDLGQVAGWSDVADYSRHPVVWVNGTAQDIGLPPEGIGVEVKKINNRGQVIGYIEMPDDMFYSVHAFVVTPRDTDSDDAPDTWYADDDGDGYNDLITMLDSGFSYHDSNVTDINDLGQVLFLGGYDSYIWQDGTYTRITGLGTKGVNAMEINNRSQVVGSYNIATNVNHGFIWENGVAWDVGINGTYTSARHINDNGQVVGQDSRSAYFLSNGVLTYINVPDVTSIYPITINEDGTVLAMDYSHSPERSFLWKDGVTTFIGTLGGASERSVALNGRCQVAGSSYNDSGEYHAFLYTDGAMVDLGALGGTYPNGHTYSSGYDLNNIGQVVGASLATNNTNFHAVLWETAAGNPPSIDPIPGTSADEGSELTVDAVFHDDDTGGPHTASVGWGDGSGGTAIVSEGAGGGIISSSHIYADNGVYPVTLTVTDTNGVSASVTFTVSVANIDPTATVSGDASIYLTDALILDGVSFTDPGILDTHAATVYWGDGSTSDVGVTETGGSGTVAGSHTYADKGVYTVTVTVADNDGGIGSASFDVTVLGAEDVVNDIIDVIGGLGLDPGTANSVGAKLDNALAAIADGRPDTAINMLEAFIKQVTALSGKKITTEDAAMLIDAARTAITIIIAGQ